MEAKSGIVYSATLFTKNHFDLLEIGMQDGDLRRKEEDIFLIASERRPESVYCLSNYETHRKHNDQQINVMASDSDRIYCSLYREVKPFDDRIFFDSLSDFRFMDKDAERHCDISCGNGIVHVHPRKSLLSH